MSTRSSLEIAAGLMPWFLASDEYTKASCLTTTWPVDEHYEKAANSSLDAAEILLEVYEERLNAREGIQ